MTMATWQVMLRANEKLLHERYQQDQQRIKALEERVGMRARCAGPKAKRRRGREGGQDRVSVSVVDPTGDGVGEDEIVDKYLCLV